MSPVTASRAPVAVIGLVSALACAFLFWLLYFRESSGPPSDAFAFLPALNASLNAASATCLVLGFRAMRRGQLDTHKRWMLTAFAFSTLFLVGYITHHSLHGDTRFVGEGPVKTFYLVVLASHVILSVPALPMVLTTFFFSLSGQVERHRKLARFTFPIWLYVSVTGVGVFVMLKTLSGAPPV